MHEPMSADDGQRPAVGLGGTGDVGADSVGPVGGVRAVDQRLQRVEVDLDELVVQGSVIAAGARPPDPPRRRWPPGPSPSGRAPCSGRREHRARGADLAPMLQIVALPVAEMLSAPGPWYSTMAPVPPATVSTRATSRITSLGEDQPESVPVNRTPMTFGQRTLNGNPVITSTASAPPTPIATIPAASVGRVAVRADHHPAREGVVLQHDLVDDPAPWLPEADAVLGAHRAQELVHLELMSSAAEVDVRPGLGQDEVITVDGRRDRHLGKPGGHELQQRHLRGGVLHRHPVGAEVRVAATALHRLALGVDEVVDEDLGERQRSPGEGRGGNGPGARRRPAERVRWACLR